MPSAVFDTVVFVRALINPFGRWGDLVFRYYSRYTLVTAQPLIIEILDVLARPEVNWKFRVFPGLDVPRPLELVGEATLVELEDVPLASRHPKDDTFLATALAGDAQYLIREDQDRLVLGECESVQIVDSLRFLRILEEGESELGS